MTKREIRLSSGFKAQAKKAIFSIVFFAFTYAFILLLAVGLTALCVFGGVMLIVAFPKIITIALGIGLASLGVLVLIFLLKFVFKSQRVDYSHLYEIKRTEEPGLFKLIDEIVNEVETEFPKKVYLSTDVNAAVFYDSSFWSMILPARKNLQIGMGLVNTVTKTELKAILSHEFGHFSQKTMKVGSYVYNVNQVIFNLLHDNESYDKLIQRWAGLTGYFSIFVAVAVKIIEGIQWVLRKLYEVVNKNYMGLSREMEFHADEIAASVTGYEPLAKSLLRMNLADHSFHSVLSFYEGKIADNIKSENIYKDHLFAMNFLAEESHIPIVGHLPEVTTEELNKFNKSRLVVKDQWASHPATEERVERLEKTNFKSGEIENSPANEVFSNVEEIQRELTGRIFKEVKYNDAVRILPSDDFQTEYKKDFLSNTFSKIFNGYYDNKNPLPFELNTNSLLEEKETLEELFSDEKVDLVYTAIALQNDVEALEQIANRTIPVKTFDYDGKKYRREESKELLPKLRLELEQVNEQIRENDLKIYQYFRKCEQAKNSTSRLTNIYEEFFDSDNEFNARYEVCSALSGELQFVNHTTPFEQIEANFQQIQPHEVKLKKGIKELLEDERYKVEITAEIKESFETYLSKQWKYFGSENYLDSNLEILFTALNNYAFLLSRGYFIRKKELLDYQEGLIKKHVPQEV